MELERPASGDYLEELKRNRHRQEIVDVGEEQVKIVIFTCGGATFAFYGRDIREFLQDPAVSWVPGLPDYLPGLINVRGDIESVVDIGHFLCSEGVGREKGLIALAVRDDFRAGVMIDSIRDVTDLPVSAIAPPLSTLEGAARELACGTILYREEPVPLLDVGRLAARITL